MENEVQIIVPAGMFGPSEFDSALDKFLRAAALAALDPNSDDWFPMGTPQRNAEKYGVIFENDLFLMHPDYQDAECNCGHSEKAEDWHRGNPHSAQCYGMVRDVRIAEWEKANPEPQSGCDIFVVNGQQYDSQEAAWEVLRRDGGEFSSDRSADTEKRHQLWSNWYDRNRKAERRISKGLCAEMGIPWDDGRGSAAHCTCGQHEAASKWFTENTHDFRCPIELPNFWYKPFDFRVTWYKYIGRDTQTNKDLTQSQFGQMWRDCVGEDDWAEVI